MENSGMMAQRGTHLIEELLGTVPNNDSLEDSDSCIECLEETILDEMEELVDNDVEILEVLSAINPQTSPSSQCSPPQLDVNSNEVSKKAFSETNVICSDIDDDIQIIEHFTNDNSLTVSKKPAVEGENCLNLSAPQTPFNQSLDIDPHNSPCSNNPPHPSDSDLKNFGINVLSTFLPVQTQLTSILQDEGCVSIPCLVDKKSPICTPSSSDLHNFAKENRLDEQPPGAITHNSDLPVDLDDLNFNLDSGKARVETDFDENSNSVSCNSVEVKSPSPFTEELLLADSTDNIFTAISTFPSEELLCADSSENLFKTISTSDMCLPNITSDSLLKEEENLKFVPLGARDKSPCPEEFPLVTLPSPPPLLELLEENKATATDFASSFVPIGDESSKREPLPDQSSDLVCPASEISPETSTSVDVEIDSMAVKNTAPGHVLVENLKTESPDVFVFGQGSKNRMPTLSSVIVQPHGNASSSAGSPKKEVPSWAVPWISNDAFENADNNDPNWEILQKLETDEERYRIVRNKWRQLEIPDPRRDLTCNNFWRSQSQVSRGNCLQLQSTIDTQSRKRVRSPDKEDDTQPSKRRKMLPCTQLFDSRINDLQRQLREDHLALKARYHKELHNLSIKQQEEQNRYLRSSAPPHILKRQMMDLQYFQEKQVDDLTFKFENRVDEITHDTSRTIDLLVKASKEVLAFNRFYTDLKYANDDHCKISEEEYNQFMQTEEMFDYYDEVYRD